jgi:hypothetical protein
MMRRLLVPLLTVALELVAAVLALGPPHLAEAAAFFVTYPTQAASIAATGLLVWVVIALGAIATVALSMRELYHRPGRSAWRFWEGSVLFVGILVLLAGAVHNATYQVPMTGGSISQARHALEALQPVGH